MQIFFLCNSVTLFTGESSSKAHHGGSGGNIESDVDSDVESNIDEVENESEEPSDDVVRWKLGQKPQILKLMKAQVYHHKGQEEIFFLGDSIQIMNVYEVKIQYSSH